MATTTRPATDLQPLVAAQSVTREAVRAQTIALAVAATRSFDGWYDSDRITKWAADLVKVLEPLLRLLARNTDAYAARSVAGVSGSPFRPVGAIDVNDLRTGITHSGAFARATDVYRYQQSRFDQFARELQAAADTAILKPIDLIDPIEAAVNRSADVAETDTALVVQQQVHHTFTEAHTNGLITGWRRILHPELSETGSCGLCVAASTRVYRVDVLMPIHPPTCKCIPAAVKDGHDPGHILNEQDLARVYADAGGSTLREDLKRTRYRIDEHGNLGPVLSDGSSKPKTSQRAEREAKTRPHKTPEQAHTALVRLHEEMAGILPKARSLNDQDPKKWGAYLQKLEARVTDLERQVAA